MAIAVIYISVVLMLPIFFLIALFRSDKSKYGLRHSAWPSDDDFSQISNTSNVRSDDDFFPCQSNPTGVQSLYLSYLDDVHTALQGSYKIKAKEDSRLSNTRHFACLAIKSLNAQQLLDGPLLHCEEMSELEVDYACPQCFLDHSLPSLATLTAHKSLVHGSWVNDDDQTNSSYDFSRNLTKRIHDKVHFTQQQFKPSKDAVIIYTTCNQLNTSILTLGHLKHSLTHADLVVVDDHSIDGTEEYLTKKGYFVIGKEKAQGLTHSWNTGFRYAVLAGYQYVFFANNDAIVPRGSIQIMLQDLRDNALIVPMTTLKGAGHNPSQEITRALQLKPMRADFANNPRHLQNIQDVLSQNNLLQQRDSPRTTPSLHKSKPRFNGFFFGVNVSAMETVAVRFPEELFDSGSVMVGQEDAMMARMQRFNVTPHISLGSFLYHIKSVTVSAARRNQSELMNSERKGKDGANHSHQDIRENLNHYHPEMTRLQSAECPITYPELYRKYFSSESIFPTAESTVEVFPPDNIKARGHTSTHDTSASSPARPGQGYDEEFSARRRRRQSQGQRQGQGIDFSGQNDKTNKLIPTANEVSPKQRTPKIIIAFATSDPAKSPLAGDIFTAHELGTSLSSQCSAVFDVRFLRKGPDWYNASMLHNVDLLIAMLDEYDISKALAAVDVKTDSDIEANLDPTAIRRQTNPSMIAVAWMRNWFNRWLSRPWIGNYDLLLTSSQLSKDFFTNFSDTFGLQTQCSQGCPKLSSTGSEGGLVNKGGKRFNVPVDLLRIATNANRFHSGAPQPQFTAEYVFTGSYHGAHRRIMNFDPAAIPQYQGIIFGKGWQGANVTAAWKNISLGEVPYSMMPAVYRSSKITIDDANHVTEPWSSVNSRVFDALASGSLVLSNGKAGCDEIFSDPPLPTFTDEKELAELIAHYLQHKQARKALVRKLQQQVTTMHSYDYRAKELGDIVAQKFGYDMQCEATRNEGADEGERGSCSSSDQSCPGTAERSLQTKADNQTQWQPLPTTTTLCMGIRTFQTHGIQLDILMNGLRQQYEKSAYRSQLNLRLFAVNTDTTSPAYEQSLRETMLQVNPTQTEDDAQLEGFSAHLLTDMSNPPRTCHNAFYGYDSTELLLSYMIGRKSLASTPRSQIKSSQGLNHEGCSWVMLTNGDNVYNSAWLDAIALSLLDPTANLVGWDFVTHHTRDDSSEQVVRVEIKRGFVDLGSVAIRADRLNQFNSSQAGARFLPQSILTQDLMARDFFAIESVHKAIAERSVRLIHKVLLFHQ